MKTGHGPVGLAEVAGQRGVVDPAGAEGAIVLMGDPEGKLILVGLPAPVPFLLVPQRAAVRRGGGDKVVQQKMKGQDDTRQAQDEQDHSLKFTEATNFMQDFFKPHGDRKAELRSVSQSQVSLGV